MRFKDFWYIINDVFIVNGNGNIEKINTWSSRQLAMHVFWKCYFSILSMYCWCDSDAQDLINREECYADTLSRYNILNERHKKFGNLSLWKQQQHLLKTLHKNSKLAMTPSSKNYGPVTVKHSCYVHMQLRNI